MLRKPKATDCDVEVTRRKRQVLGVALSQRNHVAAVEQAVASFGQHRRIDVGQPHLAARPPCAARTRSPGHPFRLRCQAPSCPRVRWLHARRTPSTSDAIRPTSHRSSGRSFDATESKTPATRRDLSDSSTSAKPKCVVVEVLSMVAATGRARRDDICLCWFAAGTCRFQLLQVFIPQAALIERPVRTGTPTNKCRSYARPKTAAGLRSDRSAALR